MDGKRISMILLLALLLVVPALAQTDSATHKHYADRFPKLSPLKVDMGNSLSTQKTMSGWLSSSQLSLMPSDSIKNADGIESVVVRKHPAVDSVEAQKAQYRYSRGRQNYEGSDNMKWIRNEIVFKRMKDRQKVLAPVPYRR